MWTNAWDVFRRTSSRVGCGRRAAVDWHGVFWVQRDFVFSMNLYFQIREHDHWLRETQSSQRRLGEGATTASQSAHRELAPTDPHQPRVPFIVLLPENHGVS